MDAYEKMLQPYPNLLTVKHLIELDIYGSAHAVSRARAKGTAPPVLEFGSKKLRFPKQKLIEWLRDKEV